LIYTLVSARCEEAGKAIKRVQVPSISELERQVDEMASQLGQLTKQLGILQQEVKDLKQRSDLLLKQRDDPLPLMLAIIAIILSAIAVSWLVLGRIRRRA